MGLLDAGEARSDARLELNPRAFPLNITRYRSGVRTLSGGVLISERAYFM